MALWICSLPLLLLLAVSAPTASQLAPNQRLCGSELVSTLLFVCGDRGIYSPTTRRNAEQPLVNGLLSSKVEAPLREIQKMKRGIVEQCCENICSVDELESYCNAP